MGLGVWITTCPEAMGRGFGVIFETKAVSWDSDSEPGSPVSWDLTLDEASYFRASARPGQLGLRDAPHMVGSNGIVSMVKIVSLSARVENLKVKRKKVSYLNKEICQCFECFSDSYACERFTYPYICIVVSWLYSNKNLLLLTLFHFSFYVWLSVWIYIDRSTK